MPGRSLPDTRSAELGRAGFGLASWGNVDDVIGRSTTPFATRLGSGDYVAVVIAYWGGVPTGSAAALGPFWPLA